MKKILSMMLLINIVVALFAGCAPTPEELYREQYDLGIRYLSEGNYEEAIIAFEAAIEIDPKSVEPYFELSGIYLALEQYDKAQEYAMLTLDTMHASEVAESGYENLENELFYTVVREENQYDRNGNLVGLVKYNQMGYVIETIRYHDDGSIIFHGFHELNGRGLGIQTIWYYPDGGIGQIDDYNDNGVRIKTTSFAPEGYLAAEHDYDGTTGKRIYSIDYAFEPGAENHYYYISEYDENGYAIKITWYDGDGTMASYLIYTRGEDGTPISRIHYRADGRIVDEQVY